MMASHSIWKIILISWWIQLDFMPTMYCKFNTGIEHILSKEDVLLINDTENPKCFTRTREDFTCFFETKDNGTYDFIYNSEGEPKKRCKMSIHAKDNGTFLHVCLFPRSDFYLFVETKVEVVDRTKNASLYHRTVCVEDLCLLDPPFNVSLQPNDNEGEIIVALETVNLKYIPEKEYMIRYSSMKHGEKTVKGKEASFQLKLVPGEEVKVQASVKCVSTSGSHPGYWSAWSKPARATVPQPAVDISLECFTDDLQNVTCHWSSSKYKGENDYKLFYKTRQSLSWTGWIKCQDEGNLPDTCSFQGDKFVEIKVKLSSPAAAVKPLFFTEAFWLNKSIKSAPPSHLKGKLNQGKLCLDWEAPLPSLSSHLQYEVETQIKGGETKRSVTVRNTSTCVDLPYGCQFTVKVRAKPDGPIYSGTWSDWSDVFSDATTQNTEMMLMWSISVSMLIFAISLMAAFFFNCRKLQLYFWPPVPNLEKVLQGFLTDINQQKWGPSVTAKLSFEEATSSVVEIMSDGEIPGLGKPSEESSDLLSSDGSSSTEEQADGSPGSDILTDYVTLNKDLAILCLEQNSYVYEEFKDGEEPERGDELKTCCCVKPCSCNNYFNRSYLLLAHSTDSLSHKINNGKSARNSYTNITLR